jgi:hypothetical protein
MFELCSVPTKRRLLSCASGVRQKAVAKTSDSVDVLLPNGDGGGGASYLAADLKRRRRWQWMKITRTNMTMSRSRRS